MKRVLVVEGSDDLHAISSIMQIHRVPRIDRVDDGKGANNILGSLLQRLKESDLERFGVVVDADENLQSRWEQIRDRLRSAGYQNVPDNPEPNGTVFQANDDLRIGIWLMPNNQLPGILEDFLAFLVPSNDTLLPRVDQFLNSIPESERKFPPVRKPKARIHSWLAIQEEPGKPLGQSITAKYLDATNPESQAFVDWVKRLFFE